MLRRLRFITPLLLASFCLAGCWVPVKEDNRSGQKPITKVQNSGRQGTEPEIIEIPPGQTAPNLLDTIDPCDARLQEIGGALLIYYGVNKTLPPKLEDAIAMAGQFGEAGLSTACPLGKGEQYLYIRQSLNAAISGQKLVAYAPIPAKDGKRRALMMSLVAGATGSTPTAGVARLTDDELKKHLAGAPAAGQ